MSIERFAERLNDLMRSEQVSRRALSLKTGLQRKSILNWLEGKYYPRYDALITLADFFRVSADYLAGISKSNESKIVVGKTPVEEVPARFLKILNRYMQIEGYTKYKLAKLLGMGQTTLNRWFERGSMPETSTLIKLSVLMKEPLDYLLSREY